MQKDKIIQQMNLMIESFSSDPNILCFLGLGSLANQDRLDDYSDLDFFLIVQEGTKKSYLSDLSWISNEPLAYQFLNTKDGYKAMTSNGVFMEFAVFEVDELKDIPFSPGKILYKKDDFDPSIVYRNDVKLNHGNIEYRVNESLTNLYIGILRHFRGEVQSAFSFIQVYAMHHIYHLLSEVYKETPQEIDRYVQERRIEFRFPNQKDMLLSMTQGSKHNLESASAILEFLTTNFKTNETLVCLIQQLIEKKGYHEKE